MSGLTPFVSSQSMQKRMEKPTSVEMDQWTRSLSKGAPQSRLCVKSRTILHLDAALNWLSRPTAGQDICHWRGQNRCQITQVLSAEVNTQPPMLLSSYTHRL